MINDKKATCFVSYCHSDIDSVTLDYLVYLLESRSGQKYELLLDKKDIRIGDNISEFMALLNKVDAVIIILTPEYNRRIRERKGGVYTEYTRIISRYQEIQNRRKSGAKTSEIDGYFEILPLIFSGDFSSSVPDEIRNLMCQDFVGLRAMKNPRGKFVITNQVKRQYLPQIQIISDKLTAMNSLKSRSFDALYDELYAKLFVDLKADVMKLDQNFTDRLFVKTYSFKKVQAQKVLFLIGRKGSGKSTIAELLEILNKDKYKGRIRITADDFNLSSLFALFNVDRTRSDTKAAVRRNDCFQYAWEAFFIICCIEIIVDLSLHNHLTDYQESHTSSLKMFLNKLQGAWAGAAQKQKKNAYFFHAFNSAINFIDVCITKARTNEQLFYSDLQGLYDLSGFLDYVFGKNVLNDLSKIINTCKKNFLITLDGFDTSFDDFRRESLTQNLDLEKRAKFEVDWLRALLLLVINIRNNPDPENRLYDLMEFCITVPKDRFYEVKTTERDNYRYHNRHSAVDWSGIELAQLSWWPKLLWHNPTR